MNRLTITAALVCCAVAGAGGPVVLLETKVSQFRDAATAAHSQAPGVEVDVGDADAAAKLADAPVIIAIGQKAFQLAIDKAPKATIIFCLVLGVTRERLTETITGVPFEPDPVTSVAKLREVAPAVKRVGMIYNPASSEWFVSEVVKAAKAGGLTLIVRTAATPQEARDAANSLLQGVELLWLPPDPKLFPKDLVLYLLTVAAERSIPVVGFLDSMAQAGALASLSTDYAEAGRRAGALAAEVAGRPEGLRLAAPGPSWAPGKLTLNLKTAASLHIKPSATAESQASQVLK